MAIQEFTRPAATITAVQWTGDNLGEIREFAGDTPVAAVSGLLTIGLSDGLNVVKVGWWVYRDHGTVGVCTDGTMRLQHWEPAA